MRKLEELVAEQAAGAQEAESRYTEVAEAVSNRLRVSLELRNLLSQFEIRIYDQIAQFDKELKSKLEILK